MVQFKTAWMQKEQVLDKKVAEDVKIGDFVYIGDGTDDKAVDTLYKTNLLSEADYIIAQSDMTMEYGHIPVEQHDHRYSDVVKASTSKKKVAVFFILDESDIILD